MSSRQALADLTIYDQNGWSFYMKGVQCRVHALDIEVVLRRKANAEFRGVGVNYFW
jgi:hypothetical protein